MKSWRTAGSIEDHTVNFGDPNNDPRYTEILKHLQNIHAELLNSDLTSVDPELLVKNLGEIRLNVNKLFAFINYYIDALSNLELAYADKRKSLFVEKMSEPKGSVSKAESYAREMMRIDEAEIKVVQNRIKQIQNEYERYNTIAIYLHARMKENQSEKFMG